jgi:hypothetical protein
MFSLFLPIKHGMTAEIISCRGPRTLTLQTPEETLS